MSVQSNKHPDGWGVAYYVGASPHLIKSANQAVTDRLFQRVSGVVSSETVVAHIRKATQGGHSPVNAHPFQYGPWIFAHNGNVSDFERLRPAMVELIHPELRPFVLGETDSEVIFYIILSRLRERFDIFARDFSPMELAEAVLDGIGQVADLVGGYSHDTNGPPTDTYLTCIITNGEVMVAHQGGKELYYSTWKTECPEKHECPSFGRSCEAPSTPGDTVNHLLISSEPLLGENHWNELAPGQLVAVDQNMTFATYGSFMMNAAMI